MASISFTTATAKSLCTDDEFQLFQLAQPRKLASLSEVELNDLVVRSRTARNKWRDQSRTQRRKSQAVKGQRQTDENARSKQKTELLAEIHQVFVDRQKEVKTGKADVPKGKRPATVPRSDRKIVHRVVRSTNRENLAAEKRGRNRTAKKSESATANSDSAAAGSKSTTKKTATKKAAVKKTVAKKPAVKKASPKKTAAKKTPVRSAARERILQQQQAAETKADSVTNARTHQKPKAADLSKAAQKKLNRPAKAIASKSRVARGGGTRIQGHVSASGKRSQARRDSK